ncbi:sensor histidine kinase [Mongoliitalea daihaiensis]|uniref:sensor histidine kinase n=1 Tax=Mongoliitalea daihaiensis TaxID=2782006 RepID=UPI001F43915E|nr:HAMP domain-containing sensor histidine kinase [Mongoliitalea daihaiensis]UJP65734.1 HAMP domain-containing histidine kinase [Mongoliitalea daihaiensis]
MSKFQMNVIIVLMTLASIGLIGFQYYWVKNAFKINEERFEQNIYQSLFSTISQLEKGETSEIFLSYLAKDPNLQEFLFQKIEPIDIQVSTRSLQRRRPSVRDSMMQLTIPNVSQRFRRIIQSSGVEINVRSDLEQFFLYLTPEIASSLFTPDEMEILLQEKERQLQYLDQTESTFSQRRGQEIVTEYNIADALEKIRRANMKIEAMNQAWAELLEGQQNILSRLDTVQVRELFRNQLKERGIGQPFELAIIEDAKVMIPLTDILDSSSLVSKGIQAKLFPSDILGKDNFLVVNFPNKRNYILRQIWVPLISSLSFLTIVIFCFVYAIRVIILQKKLSEIKNDFINNMTHEFKTPIATVSLAVEALQDPAFAQEETFRKRYLNIIKDENKRLGTQVEKVLQAATLDKQDLKLKLEQIELREIVEKITAQFALQVEKKGGEISLVAEVEHTQLQGDAFHIAHIINNLLDNALKYTPSKPTIEIRLWEDGQYLCVSVKDNGLGMSKDSAKKIFEKFYRVPTGNIHDVKGFGLGLAYVKTMVEAHQGLVTVSSELGKGSTFTIKLPKQP